MKLFSSSGIARKLQGFQVLVKESDDIKPSFGNSKINIPEKTKYHILKFYFRSRLIDTL